MPTVSCPYDGTREPFGTPEGGEFHAFGLGSSQYFSSLTALSPLHLAASQGLNRRPIVKAPGGLRPLADPHPAEQRPVAVDPGALDPQAAGQLAGADQLGLALWRALLQQLGHPNGDPLDGLRGEVDRDPRRRCPRPRPRGGQKSRPALAGIALRARNRFLITRPLCRREAATRASPASAVFESRLEVVDAVLGPGV